VHHVHFQGEVLLVDPVLAGGVKVELGEGEVCAVEGCGAIANHFDCGPEVFEFRGGNRGDGDGGWG